MSFKNKAQKGNIKSIICGVSCTMRCIKTFGLSTRYLTFCSSNRRCSASKKGRSKRISSGKLTAAVSSLVSCCGLNSKSIKVENTTKANKEMKKYNRNGGT